MKKYRVCKLNIVVYAFDKKDAENQVFKLLCELNGNEHGRADPYISQKAKFELLEDGND